MRLTDFSVRNWQFTVILFAMLAAVGLASWHSVPRLEDPPIDFPTFTIVAVYPGAGPTDLERLVVTELEEQLEGLEHVKHIDSRMRDGVATVRVEFEEDQDVEEKHDEVIREVNALRPKLPAELTRLDINKATTLDVNIVQVALVSATASYRVLDSLAEALEDRIARVPGVREVERWGAPDRQVDVELDLGRLAELHLPMGLVLQSIGGESVDIPGGSVEAGTRRYSVRTSGSYETLDDVRSTIVRSGEGRLVRVGDIARVHWSHADSTHRARFSGQRAVFVTANQQNGFTTKSVRDGIYAELDRFAETLPAAVTLERGFDQAANVSLRLSRLGVDFLIAVALVLVTLLPLGGRASLIVMISIPLSLAMGLTALHWLGFTLNQLTIVGMVLALGLLVDDSIVVVENIARFRRRGFSRVEAAIAGTSQIWVAILGATATLIAAFLPLLILPGGPGRFIRSMPVTVVVTVLASLFVAVTIIPWLASRLLPAVADPHGNRILQAFDRTIHRTYAPLLEWALKRPTIALVGAAAFVVAGVALVPLVGFSLFPKAETPQFYVNITAPEGTSIAVTDSAARFAERVIGARPEVKAIYTSVGHDNPMVYYNIVPRVDDPRVGQLFVLLDRYDQRRTTPMLDTLRAKLADYPGAEIALREFENGPPVDAPIALRIIGPGLDTLRALAAKLETIVEATPGTQYVSNPVRVARTDLRVAIDREKAGLLGIQTLEIDRTVRLGIAGLTAGTLRDHDGEQRAIVVRLASNSRPAPGDLDRVHVASAAGRLVPLTQIVAVRLERAVPEIQRYDGERTVTIASNVRTGFNTDRVTKAILGQLDALEVPPGYRIVAGGEIEARGHSFGGVGSAVIVAVFLVIAILVLEFRTFRSTLIVASVIPLGVAGGIAALFLAGDTLSFTATIGFVALIGIEIKTSILLVDRTNQLRAEGEELDTAVRKAGEERFLPIVLTSLTAIGGLLPLALQGSGFYAPLAWVIIGGLVSSTLLARIVTPVLYRTLTPAVSPIATA
jgi:multidrug efflux pump subunit AcrB